MNGGCNRKGYGTASPALQRPCYARFVHPGIVIIAIVGVSACKSRSESPTPAPSETTSIVREPVPAPATIDPPSAPGALAPNLHAAGDGVLATWLEPLGEGKHRLRFSKWSGGAWSTPGTIVENARLVASWADVPSVARGGDQALVAHWAEASGDSPYAYDAVVARSTDDGATWKVLGTLHEDRAPAEHGFVSLVPDAKGVRAIWLDGRDAGSDGGATALRTALVGDSIQGEAVVDSMVCDCCGTSAVATASGALVVYRDRTEGEIRDIGSARLVDGAWKQAGVRADGWQIAGCPVNGPAVATNGRMVAVAWYTYANSSHRVQVAFSEDTGASFAEPIDVDLPRGARAPAGRVAIVLENETTAVVSWLASNREDAAILARRVGRDGRLGDELRIGGTTAGRDAGFPRLARHDDGMVAIWTEPGEPSKLRAVHVSFAALPALGTGNTDGDRTRRPPAIAAGSPAPAIELVALDGTTGSLATLRGKVVLLNLWATWCEPCRHELPVLGGLHTREAERGLVVVGINVDRTKSREDIAKFVAGQKLPFPVWLDPEDRASTALGAVTYPVNVLIGRDGTILWRRDGAIRSDDPELSAALDAALE